MGIGIFLLVAGAALVFAIDVDLPYVSDDTAGLVLMGLGALAFVIGLVRAVRPARPERAEEPAGDRSHPAA